jgi:acyl carrier protein|tara:strand:+ start:16543 stop:16791 length:249 start_codon:yes stop_codon:yes gene_type:complete
VTEADVYHTLNGIFRAQFLLEDIDLTPTTSAVDIEGWDSLRHIELILVIESHFGIQFHSREVDSMSNIGDLVEYIGAHLHAS